jgi:hippurate hydrolase
MVHDGIDGMDKVLEEAGGLLEPAVALRRRIHQRPELGLDLPETQAAVLDALEPLPLSVTTGPSTTSVVAVLQGEGAGAADGPTVLLRGDMDALPMPEDTGLDFASVVDGAMHACGHDAHVAMLAGAARLLAERRGELGGRVAFMFQPGEEGHHGARVMLDDGLLDQVTEGAQPVSMAFAIHQTPTLASGVVATRPRALLASSDTLLITVRGRGGHASMPHHALDPIPIACEIVTALQSMVTRRVDAFDPAIVTIARIQAGTTSNVVPETAELLGTIRAVSDRTRSAVLDDIKRLAEGIAAAHGAEADVTIDGGYPVTVNDEDAARFVLDTAGAVLGARNARLMPTPFMGAEDWSYVLQQVPGCMAFLGTAPADGRPAAPNHSNRMVLDEGAMAAGIATYAAVALRWLRPDRQ